MNQIIINKISDLEQAIEDSIYIFGQQSLIEEEIYNNMWALTFSDRLIKKLEIKDLEKFLSRLIENRTLQLSSIDTKLQATFYLWFDKQALQLRFNFISGHNQVLPFGCKVKLLDSYISILDDFIVIARKVALEGDDIEFLTPDQEIADESEEEFVLDVYIQVLP